MEERLRKFATLVELGSFTKAAESLHVSQPALSAAIKKLERELKGLLIVRGSQPLTLTTAGEYAYMTAKELSVSTSNLTNKLEQLKQRKPSIAVGMIDSVAQAVFGYGTAFSELEQHAHVSLIVDNSRNLPAAVRSGELDIAFITEPSMRAAEESLIYTPVGVEPLLAVCREDELPVVQAALARGSLSPFISYDRSSNTYRLISQAYAKAHIKLSPTFYSTSPSVILQLVSVGRGAAVLPYLLVKEMIEHKQLTIMPIGNDLVVGRPIVYITQQGRELSPLLLAAANETRELLSSLRMLADKATRSMSPRTSP